MRSLSIVPLFVLSAACAAAAPPPAASAVPTSAASAATSAATSGAAPTKAASTSATFDAANAFTLDVYRSLDGRKGNLFFSGASLRDALGQAYLGARGDTASEMSAALHLDRDPIESAAQAKAEGAAWAAAKGSAELVVANRLWADKRFPIAPSFTQRALEAYGAPVESLDFLGNPEASRVTINRWVGVQTKERIPDLLPAGSLSNATRLVITNAIYFKGDWASPFTKEATRDAPFAIDGKTSAPVGMMHETATAKLASGDGAHVLEMAYAGSTLAMDVILPDAPDGLGAIEGKLTPDALARWTSQLAPTRVSIGMPKVKFTWGESMNDTLKKLGMKKAFTSADFRGIAESDPIAIDQVVHKAFVAIDEKGTEAAAATGVTMIAATAFSPPAASFVADHPFVFVVRDTVRGEILFMGRVTDPRA